MEMNMMKRKGRTGFGVKRKRQLGDLVKVMRCSATCGNGAGWLWDGGK